MLDQAEMRWLLALLAGCAGAPEAPEAPVFVRGGVVVEAEAETQGQALPGDRTLVPMSWSPGQSVRVGTLDAVAPQQASCVSLFEVALADVSGWMAMGGAPPDTALSFSPDGRWLAVGSWDGAVLLVDGWSGEVRSRLSLAETLVKQVAWSSDSRVLYATEQSPDARVVALDVPELSVRASLRLADHVETSAPPPADDLYGVYTLPAAYALEVLREGPEANDLIVVGTHGWNDADGVRQNRARVLRLDPDLQVEAAWPAEGAADVVILSMAVRAGRVVLSVGRSAEGPSEQGLLIDALHTLALPELSPVDAVRIPPLTPWFDRSFVWEALDLSADGTLAVGLGDGRVATWADGEAPLIHPLGAPVPVADLAVVASVGHLVWVDGHVLALTAGTNIPYGAAHPDLRPPQPHPNENALFSLAPADGRMAWTWHGPHRLAGLTLADDGRTLVVGAGQRLTDTRRDLFGALVFEIENGRGDLAAFCPSPSPVFFRHAVHTDGRIAVAEHPYREGDRVRGRYRVRVFR